MFTDAQKATFWARVQKTPFCWNWMGAKDKDGYGVAKCAGKNYQAHRLAWFMTNGETVRLVRHGCDNRLCVNPAHLFLSDKVDTFVKRDKSPIVLDYGKARSIRLKRIKMHRSVSELAQEYGVDRQTIIDVLRGRTWK